MAVIIYHDTENNPVERPGEPCLNCGETWDHHISWACNGTGIGDTRKSKVPANVRYLTTDMMTGGNANFQGTVAATAAASAATPALIPPFSVECINDCQPDLQLGKTYTVISIFPGGQYEVKGIMGGWLPSRFKLLTSATTSTPTYTFPLIVECIESHDRGGVDKVVKGQTYTAVKLHPSGKDFHLQGMTASFKIDRFKLLTPTSGHKATHAATQAPDLSDWKVWRDVGKDPKTCACGIHKSMCSYHKEG